MAVEAARQASGGLTFLVFICAHFSTQGREFRRAVSTDLRLNHFVLATRECRHVLSYYLNQATADATQLPVIAGPVEATVTGNVLVQAIASGRFASLSEGRAYLAGKVRLKKFMPRPAPAFEERFRRYAAIETRWVGEQIR